MRRVRQLHHNGCVPACIATLAGLTYGQACALFSKPYSAWKRWGTSEARTLEALDRAGLRHRRRVTLPDDNASILTVDERASCGRWEGLHAVVWDPRRQRVLDPFVGREGMRRHLPVKAYLSAVTDIIEVLNVPTAATRKNRRKGSVVSPYLGEEATP